MLKPLCKEMDFHPDRHIPIDPIGVSFIRIFDIFLQGNISIDEINIPPALMQQIIVMRELLSTAVSKSTYIHQTNNCYKVLL